MIMKKMLLSLSMMASTLSAMAEDYPYLTFETANGAKTSISTTSLTITLRDGKLMAGSIELTLADLSKMYFSISDETTGIEEVSVAMLDDTADIYDLHGRKISKEQMRCGIYVIKTKNGTHKVSVK